MALFTVALFTVAVVRATVSHLLPTRVQSSARL